MNTTKEGIEVKAGQVWRDLDARMGNRTCRVIDVVDGKAVMELVIKAHPFSAPKTKVSIRRMHKSSTGWALVSEAA